MVLQDPLRDGCYAQLGVSIAHEQPLIQPAAAKLGREVQRQLEDGEPVLKFPGDLVEEVAREAKSPVCLLSATLRPELPYQATDPHTFFGVTCDANPAESARNAKLSNAHFHWRASETLVILKGSVRLYAWRGRRLFTCAAGVGDILHVPQGVPHKLEIDPDVATVVYVVRSPAAVSDYKQEWPPKTRPHRPG